jgi:bifunctional non-homologous end joining protein LigD
MPGDPLSADTQSPTLIDITAIGRPGVPRTIAPMRPRLAADAFNSPDHIFELKWDGMRALVGRGEGGVRVVDRHGGDLLPLLPELADMRIPEGILLDGEVIFCDSRGRPSYELLAERFLRERPPLLPGARPAARRRGPLFVAFDLLYDDGRPLLSMPLEERRARLQGRGLRGPIVFVPDHLDGDGEPFFDVVAEYGLEGMVAKRRDSRYIPGARTADWLKCHVTPRSDVVLGGLVEDRGRAQTALCAVWAGEELVFAAEARVPHLYAEWLSGATRAFTAAASPFAGPVRVGAGTRWLRPKLVAMVEHEGHADGQLADAQFRGLRFDGRPEDCRRDDPVDVPDAPSRLGPERPRLILLRSLPFPVD